MKPDPNVPNDGLLVSKKPMTPEEKRARFGDLLKPLPAAVGKRKKALPFADHRSRETKK